jgi:hypothetical protein
VKDAWITDVAGLFPVRLHQTIVRRLVLALRPRELREPKRGLGVRYDVGRRVVDEPDALECGLDVPVEPLAVAADEVRAWDSRGWILGMEIEGQPLDGRAEPARKPLGRPLADAAERSDVVRPDQDLVFWHVCPAY